MRQSTFEFEDPEWTQENIGLSAYFVFDHWVLILLGSVPVFGYSERVSILLPSQLFGFVFDIDRKVSK